MTTRHENATAFGATRPVPVSRPKALICKSGPESVVDDCLFRLSSETDVEHVPSLAEAMQRCLKGDVDILFVNLSSSYTARELTALSAFRSLAPKAWVVAVAERELTEVLLDAGLADEVMVPSSPLPS